MPNWEKLDFIDGDFVLIKTPPIVYASIIRQYHLAFLAQVEGLNIYPFDEVVELQIFEMFRVYYQKIANQIPVVGLHEKNDNLKTLGSTLVIDASCLTSKSRYEFFICTDPVQHPVTQKLIVGLSKLSQLMGYTYAVGDTTPPKHTTGDSELDIWVDAMLVFKARSHKLVQEFGASDLAKMVVQANHRLTPPNEDEEGRESLHIPLASVGGNVPDHPLFVENRERITQWLREIRIELPEGW